METAKPMRLSWIAAILLSMLLCLCAWLFSSVLTRSQSDTVLSDAVLLPCVSTQTIEIWQDGVLYSDGTTLHAVNSQGRQKWSYPVGIGLNFSVGSSAVAAWTSTSLSLLDLKSGASLLTTSMSDSILSAKAGSTYLAVHLGEENNSRILITDLTGKQIDSISLEGLTVLDYGFFSNGSMLWVMLLDTQGSQPLSRISTYRPGRVQSGNITDSEQVLYQVSFNSSTVQTVGLTYLKTYDYTGTELENQRTLVYGWSMLDADKTLDPPLYLFAPTGETGSTNVVSDVRVISGSIDRTLRLPFPCYAVTARSHTLYGFARSTVSIYPLNAKRATSYMLPFNADAFLGLTNSNGAVLVSGSNVYLVSLP